MLPLRWRILLASSCARVQPEGTALALVLWAATTGRTNVAATLIAATTLPQLATGPVMGHVLDRASSPQRWVAAAAVLSAASCLALALSDLRLAPSLAAAVVLAVSTPVLTGGLSSVIMGWSDDHSMLAAWDGTGYNVAGLLAPALVTAVAAWHPSVTFVVLAVITLVAVVPMTTGGTAPAEREDRRADSTGDGAGDGDRPGTLDAARAIVRSRPLLAVTVATTLFSLGLGGLELALVAGVRAQGMPAERAGVAATAIAVGALAGSLLLTRGRWRPDAASMTLAAIAASGACLVVLAVAGWPLMIPVCVAIGLADGPLLVGTYRARSEHAPAGLRAGVFTIGASAKLGAGSLGALVIGAIVADGPTSVGLLAIGALGVAASAAGALLLRSRAPGSLDRAPA